MINTLKDTNFILLSLRILIAFAFMLVAFKKSVDERAVIVVLAVVYLSLAIASYLNPVRYRNIKRLLDVLLVPPMVLISKDIILALSSFLPAIFFANRDIRIALTLFWAGILAYLYVSGFSTLYALPLFIALLLASLSPDLVENIKRERHYIRKLRNSYKELAKSLAQLEREAKEKEYLSFILEKVIEDNSPEDFLLRIKERFSLKKIVVIPKKEIKSEGPIMDRENNALYVPVFFEKGSAYVVFYLNTPFEFYDKELINALEKSAKLLNLYIVGFDDDTKKDTVKIAV